MTPISVMHIKDQSLNIFISYVINWLFFCKNYLNISLMFSDKMAFENGHSFEGISGISPNNDSAVFNEESKQEIFYTIKINAPQGQYSPLPPQTSTPEQPEREPRSGTNKNPFTLETSGYEINRELYSDEEIRDAFKAIDIDRDGALTFDDISFFLKCMGQEHAS